MKLRLLHRLSLPILFFLAAGACTFIVEPSTISLDNTMADTLITVRGRILDEDGRGLPNLRIRLASSKTERLHWALDWEVPAIEFDSTTDTDGYFEIAVPGTSTNFRLAVIEEDSSWYPWPIIDLRQTGLHLGVFRLPPMRTIAGLALDAQGVPMSGASLRIAERHFLYRLTPPVVLVHEYDDFVWTIDSYGRAVPTSESGVLTTTTDHRGRFEFRGRFVNPMICLIDAGAIPHAYTCGSPFGWDEIVLQAHPTREESFMFVKEDGSPADGAYCAVPVAQCWPDHAILKSFGRIPESGRVTVRTESTSSGTVAVRWSENHPWLVRSSFWTEGEATPMVVPVPRDLGVRVTDEDGVPITGASVMSTIDFWEERLLPAGTVVNDPIYFRESEAGYYVARKVPASEVIAFVAADGFMLGAFQWSALDFADFDPQWHSEGEIILHRASFPVIAVVAGPEGVPLAGALMKTGTLTTWSSDESMCEIHDHMVPPFFGMTNQEGMWRPGPVCSHGSWFACRAGASTHKIAWDGSSHGLTLTTDPLTDLSGVVRYKDVPLADMLIGLEGDRLRDQEIFFRADRDGHFATTVSRHGTYTLRVYPTIGGTSAPELLIQRVVIGTENSVRLDLQLDPQWNLPSGTVHGFLLVDGKPAQGWLAVDCAPGAQTLASLPDSRRHLMAEIAEHLASSISANRFPLRFGIPLMEGGSFRLSVPSGAVRIRFHEEGETVFDARRPLLESVIAQGQELELPIDLLSGFLRVTVLNPNGNPVAAAPVTIQRMHPDDGSWYLRTNHFGVCQLPLQPGQYQIAVADPSTDSFPFVSRPNRWHPMERIEETVAILPWEKVRIVMYLK